MKKQVVVILGAVAPKVHSVVYKGQAELGLATPTEVSIYVPRTILKALSPIDDEPADLKITIELGS